MRASLLPCASWSSLRPSSLSSLPSFLLPWWLELKVLYVDPSLRERIHAQTFLVDIIARKKSLREENKCMCG